LRLSADGLSMEQWLMLQDLNKEGVEYGTNQKSGLYCVDFTTESAPKTVFPLQEEVETQTKFAGHHFELAIRYEQVPNIQI